MSRFSGGGRTRRVLAATVSGAVVALAALTQVAAPAAAADATVPGTFSPVEPVRVLDTRDATGVPVAASVPGGEVVTFKVAGTDTVPASAGAAVLNVTVTGTSGPGHITAYPAGAEVPATSSLNFTAGATVANAVTVELGEGGSVTLLNGSSAPVELIADVSGWYAGGAPAAAGAFAAVDPTRILDTRSGAGLPGGAPAVVAAGDEISFGVGDGDVVPKSAAAAVLNVTVTRTTAPGHITAYPTGATAPTASNLNFGARQSVANAVTVQIGEGGEVTLVNGSSASVHLVVDVAGYFVGGMPSVGGAFTPVVPARVLDTRNGVGTDDQAPTVVPGDGAISFDVAGEGGIPEGAAAAVLNVTVTRTSAPGHITAYPEGAEKPLASALNFAARATVPNQVTVKLSDDGRVTLANGSAASVALVVDVAGSYDAVTEPTLVSVDKPADDDADVLDISPDAQWVLYAAHPSQGAQSLHLFNTVERTTTVVDVPADGAQDARGREGVIGASVSDDGRYVAFDSDAADLVVDDTNGLRDVFVRDVTAGVTTRVGGPDGAQPDQETRSPVISGDGSSVVHSVGSDALAVWDVAGAATSPVGADFAYVAAGSINGDGRSVSYYAEDGSGGSGVFIEDRESSTATLISAEDVVGTLATQIDAAGDTVAWSEESPDLDLAYVAFVSDVGATPERISSEIPLSEEDVFPTSISADGNRVGLYSTEYVPEAQSLAFVFDRATSSFIELVGSGVGWAVLNGDGSVAAFASQEALTSEDTDEANDVYLVEVP